MNGWKKGKAVIKLRDFIITYYDGNEVRTERVYSMTYTSMTELIEQLSPDGGEVSACFPIADLGDDMLNPEYQIWSCSAARWVSLWAIEQYEANK